VPIIRRRIRQDGLRRKLVADEGTSFALRDRAAHARELAFEREHVARLDDALEAAVVDAREERDLAVVLLRCEHRHRAGLGDRLDREHPGMTGRSGNVPETTVVGPDQRRPTTACPVRARRFRRRAGTAAGVGSTTRSRPGRTARPGSRDVSVFQLLRSLLRPRCAWHFAVPTGMPAASAISSKE